MALTTRTRKLDRKPCGTAGLRKRLHEWEDETLAEVLGEARTLYERSGG